MKFNFFGFGLLSVISMGLLMSVAGVPAQTRSETKRTHAVSLDTLLGCVDEPTLRQVLKTDAYTARFELAAIRMVMEKSKRENDIDYITLRTKGFFTRGIDDSTLAIMPTDGFGNIIEESKLSFCLHYPIVTYKSTAGKNTFPDSIQIDGEGWTFNPNEIFAHADQFQFESGVFANGSEIFFTAKRGRVSIQFLCTSKGLTFYRVFYWPKD